MVSYRTLARVAFGAPLVLLCVAALGGDGINLTVTNDGIVDVYVTVYDTSVAPRATVLSHQRINGFTSVPISVSADAGGRANVAWSAISVDNTDQHCGHGTRNGLSRDVNINVHTDSDCPG